MKIKGYPESIEVDDELKEKLIAMKDQGIELPFDIELGSVKKVAYKTSLQDVYDVYKKWMVFNSTDRIDLLLAHKLTMQMKGKPVWIILIGPSSDGKSEQAMSLFNEKDSNIIHEITDKTLVSGSLGAKDLAPELDKKYVIFPDLSQLLQERTEIKGKIWAQLRELYDGRAGRRTGLKGDPNYTGIRTTLLMCSTPSIDAQILIFNDLGTRELLWRTTETQSKEIIRKVCEDEFKSEEKTKELSEITQKFLEERKVIEISLSDDVMLELENYVIYLRYMRATAEVDSYTNELRNFAFPESPARVVMSLRKLLIALLNLDQEYSYEKAMKIIKKIIFDSINQTRHRIMLVLRRYHNLNISQISADLKMGKKAVERELNVLWNLGIVDRTEVVETTTWGKEFIKEVNFELIDSHEAVKAMKEII